VGGVSINFAQRLLGTSADFREFWIINIDFARVGLAANLGGAKQ
jgi:hypothetical protein